MKINYQKLLLLSVIFPLIDYFYLSSMSNHFNQVVTRISGEGITFNYPKAIIAYFFLVLGMYYFIINDLEKDNLVEKIRDAIILGLVIYGTYDFTNGAIFKEYDYLTSVIDTTWGGTLFGLVTLTIWYIINRE